LQKAVSRNETAAGLYEKVYEDNPGVAVEYIPQPA
jgi:hypothetical protein